MALADLTDSNAVLDAIREADRLGHGVFLRQYGYRPSRQYFLVYDGRRYDSKAIAGVAHGLQHRSLGALRPGDFSGGDQTVRMRLEHLGFVVEVDSAPSRNPNWAVDELILALDLYRRQGLLDDKHPDVVHLSELLKSLPVHSTRPDAARFRNPNGVALKLANFAALDPAYTGRGMQRGGALDREVWDRYATAWPLLSEIAKELHDAAQRDPGELPVVPIEGEEFVLEGRLRFRRHFIRERDRGIVERKKLRATRSGEGLACEVCGFNFAKEYGSLGDGYVECHHTVPLSTTGERTTRIADLALVCANCHRMIHRRVPWPTIDQLRGIIHQHPQPSA